MPAVIIIVGIIANFYIDLHYYQKIFIIDIEKKDKKVFTLLSRSRTFAPLNLKPLKYEFKQFRP